jgi:ribosomal protein S13
MNITSFLFDKTLPFFRKKRKIPLDLLRLNIFQVYIQRYGINKNISYKLNRYTSIYYTYRFKNVLENDILSPISYLFHQNEESLDEFLEIKLKNNLQIHIDLYDYKGFMYRHKLPINGQKRRASKKLIRKLRPIIIK